MAYSVVTFKRRRKSKYSEPIEGKHVPAPPMQITQPATDRRVAPPPMASGSTTNNTGTKS